MRNRWCCRKYKCYLIFWFKELEKLEYRGYDSAGVFLASEGKSQLVKAVGRIAELSTKAEGVEGTAGIGHTRWATHGKPTEDNAHPHRLWNRSLCVGPQWVIENYLEIKEEYLAGHHFKGQTDTEIAAHLIGKFAEEDGLSTLEAFKKASTSSVELMLLLWWMRKIQAPSMWQKINHHSWSVLAMATIWSALMPWPWFVKPTNTWKSMTKSWWLSSW